MKKVLVLGGTGFLGRHLCEKLVRNGMTLTVPTRRLRNAADVMMLPMLYVAEADVHDPAALAELVRGHDAVINLVAILQGNEKSFHRAHVELAEKVARACDSTGVRRLIHVSALGADARNPGALPSLYLRSKSEAEKLLKAAPLSLTILRPSVMFGAGDRFLNVFADLQGMLPVVPLAGANARFQPVWVEDVASAIAHCVDERQTHSTEGITFEACGPDIHTLRELVRMAGQYSGANQGKGRPVLALPDGLARLQARFMELLPGEPLLSRDNLDSMKVDNIATGNLPGLAELGITPASLAAIAPSYLGAQGPRSGLMAKRRTAGRF
ncbi:MAG: complex I NDUFA9 subunit family protein [Pseudomonadota bacterium]